MQSNEFGRGQYVRSFVKRERTSGYLPAVFDVRFGSMCGRRLGKNCGHVSGPFVRRVRPLALMLCADRVPIKNTHFKVR